MDGFMLRLVAMATMLIDHIGWNFLEQPITLTWIGRIAFPLYAYLLAEGFLAVYQDRRRLTKHLTTLLILAVVSELGFDLLEYRLDVSSYMGSQNNILTLLLGYLGMVVTEFLLPQSSAPGDRPGLARYGALCSTYLLVAVANFMLHGNFNLVGPLLVVAFYWYLRCKKKDEAAGREWPWAKRLLLLLAIFACYLPLYFWVRSGFGDAAAWWKEVTDYLPWVAGHALAALILSFSNGKLGYRKKWFSRLYTVFYPLHIYVIGIICVLTGR